jgi:hypothetical protein
MTLADQFFFLSLTTIQVGKKIKDKKERVFGVTNITPGRHKQKGLNLLFFSLDRQASSASVF